LPWTVLEVFAFFLLHSHIAIENTVEPNMRAQNAVEPNPNNEPPNNAAITMSSNGLTTNAVKATKRHEKNLFFD
jgi:hypothetical protein